MKQKFTVYTLEDVCTKITDGSHHSPKSVPKGLPMASVKDLTGFGINIDSCRHISEEEFSKLVKQNCKPEVGDVLIAKDGASALDTVCLIRRPINVVLLSSVAILRPNPDKVLPSYLHFYLDAEPTRTYMKNAFTTGAAIPRVILKDFKKIKVLLPSIELQNKIASILSAYDDLIENNLRRIKILEEMAQMIYREWFVNFRFPGHEKVKMVKSELGMIPEGWAAVKVGELLRKIERKLRIKKDDYLEQGAIPTVDQGSSFIGGYTNDTDALHSNPLPIIVFGDHTRIIKYVDFPFASGADGTQLLYPINGDLMPAYFYYAIKNIDLSNYAYARHFKLLKEQKMIIPTNPTLNYFNECVGLLLNQISSLRKKNDNLHKTRDLFLPKLINGEIDVEKLIININGAIT